MTTTKSERILVIVNDLNVARQIVTACFALGHEPLVARDGFTGMLLAKRVKPRLILADLAIPGLDGFEIVRRVRQMRELDGCAVVAVSEMFPGRSALDEKCFDDCVLKPVNRTCVSGVIERFCASAPVEIHA